MTEANTLLLQIETRMAEFEAVMNSLMHRVAQHGALLEIAGGIAEGAIPEGAIPCADADLRDAAMELVDYINSPEKWPVLVEAVN